MDFFISNISHQTPFSFVNPMELRKKVADEIRKVIEPSNKFTSKYGSANLAITTVLERKTKELELRGPEADSELVEYFIWLPYKSIKNGDNYLISYLDFLRQGILQVLKKYNFETKQIEQKLKEIENEIIINAA